MWSSPHEDLFGHVHTLLFGYLQRDSKESHPSSPANSTVPSMGADVCRAAPAPPPLSVLPMVLSPEEGSGTMLSNELPLASTCEFIQKACSFRNLLQSDWKNQAKKTDFLLLIGVDWTAMNSLVGTHHTFSSFFPSETVTSAVNIIFKADFSGYERGTFFLSFFSISIGIDLSCLSHQPLRWHWFLANRTKLWQAPGAAKDWAFQLSIWMNTEKTCRISHHF